jgi:hypothetical protein
MILVIHITVAIISVLSSLLTLLSPTQSKLRTTQLLTVATLASGLVMVIAHPTSLGQSCISGILYLGFISLVLTMSSNKLAVMKGKIAL